MRFLLPILGILLPFSTDVVSADTLREQLMQVDRKFAASASERGLDGWMEFMADDAVRLPKQGAKAIVGKSEIRKADAALFADKARQLLWEPADGGGFDDGKLGFTTGSYRLVKKAADGKEEVLGRGTYLTWWRKSSDGSWKVILDTGNPEKP